MRIASVAPSRSKLRSSPAPESIKRDATDLEQYCLSMILLHPHVLAFVDETLVRAEQPPLSVDDFDQAQNREVFRAARLVVTENQTATPENIRGELDPTLHPQLAMLIEAPLNQPATVHDVTLEQDAQQAGLRLRERRLRREGRELHALFEDAHSDSALGDFETLYQARQANAAALLRLQQILSARTITRQTTSEPWGRS
jgi:hypothetical protein